jgi:glutathione S-transferase
MAEIILHHYDISPYAEKIRLALGLKALPWRSVHIPIVMPKPHLTTLTGGYRRTPTLQLGADLYCDTKVIARALEGLHPNPSLYPAGCDAILPALSRWAETSFMMVVTLMFGLGGVFDEDFVEDRKKMLPGVDFSQARHLVPAKRLQLAAQLDLLERQLAQRGPFLLGDSPSLADLAAYHPLLPVRLHPDLQSLLEPVAAGWIAWPPSDTASRRSWSRSRPWPSPATPAPRRLTESRRPFPTVLRPRIPWACSPRRRGREA